MAKLTEIRTRKFTKEQLSDISERIAEESGEEWVTAKSIEAYNRSLNVKKGGKFSEIFWFLINDKPALGHLCITLVPTVIILPFNICLGVVTAFLLWVAGSFIYPMIFKNCSVCRSLKSCEQIFSYTIDANEHTESRRTDDRGTRTKVRVRNEVAFVVMQCKKCKGRKIEIIALNKEKTL